MLYFLLKSPENPQALGALPPVDGIFASGGWGSSPLDSHSSLFDKF